MKVIGIISSKTEVYSYILESVNPRASYETIEGFRARVEKGMILPFGHNISHVFCTEGSVITSEWGEPEYVHED